MDTELINWQYWMVVGLFALAALGGVYWLTSLTLSRHQKKKRIVAARVRSGHLPDHVPTVRGELGNPSTGWSSITPEGGEVMVVDETPTIRIRYSDPYGKLAERTIEVERVDLHRQAIVARGNSLYDPRIYPLERIVEVRNTKTGKPFNLGLWVDAVRVAKRRRDAQVDLNVISHV